MSDKTQKWSINKNSITLLKNRMFNLSIFFGVFPLSALSILIISGKVYFISLFKIRYRG